MKKFVNLLPPEEQKRLVTERQNFEIAEFGIWIVLSIIFICAIAFTVAVFLSQSLELSNQQVLAKQAEFQSAQQAAIQKRVDSLNKDVFNFEQISAQDLKWSPYLMEFARLLPPDVSITSFSLSRDGGRVEVNGKAKTRESVLGLRRNILDSPYFKNINFPLYNLESPQDVKWKYRFFINSQNQ